MAKHREHRSTFHYQEIHLQHFVSNAILKTQQQKARHLLQAHHMQPYSAMELRPEAEKNLQLFLLH